MKEISTAQFSLNNVLTADSMIQRAEIRAMAHSKESNFKIIDKQLKYEGRIFKLYSLEVKDRHLSFKRDVIEHPGATAIVPFVERDKIILISQWRVAANGYMWEIPAGTLSAGEKPEECARRELIEETGYSAGRLEFLAKFFSCPGFCNEVIYLFAAYNLATDNSLQPDADEDISVKIFSLPEVKKMLDSGEICDAKSIIGLRTFMDAVH